MKKVLLVLAIVGMFIMPMAPAEERETNYLEDAKNLLENWEKKLATEGATWVEVKEVIQKMEFYRQILENELKSMEIEGASMREIGERLALITELDARIEWEKYFLEECERAKKEYNEGKFKVGNLNTLSGWTVYPTGGWIKTERTSGIGGICP